MEIDNFSYIPLVEWTIHSQNDTKVTENETIQLACLYLVDQFKIRPTLSKSSSGTFLDSVFIINSNLSKIELLFILRLLNSIKTNPKYQLSGVSFSITCL